MKLKISVTSYFENGVKRLSKKYHGFADDLIAFKNSLSENPKQGADLGSGIRKVRMAIKAKGKGKSGGARVITYSLIETEEETQIVLLLIYDKSDADTVDKGTILQIISESGLNK